MTTIRANSKYTALCLSDVCGVVHRFDYTTDVLVCRPNHLFYLTTHLRFSSIFNSTSLMFITGYSINKSITAVIYSYFINDERFTVLTLVNSKHQSDSIRELYYNAWWYERETSEMLGVKFLGASDSRNLLLPYGFANHPLRKDVSNNYSYTLRFDGVEANIRWCLI